MLTSKTVARKTGLSLKTLSRWANQGIIPKPAVHTHPSGRGKIGYWPDFVLERCRRIVQLRKQGHTLGNALALLGLEHVEKCLARVKQPTFADLLAEKKVPGPNGTEVDLLEVFLAVVAEDVRGSVLDRDCLPAILSQLQASRRLHLRTALRLMEAGYSPFLRYDGTTVRIEPDFLLGHPTAPEGHAFFAVPLRPAFRKFLSMIGVEDLLTPAPVRAAPKVWVREGDTIVEYDIFLGGGLGFEIIRELARTVGITPKSEEQHEPS
jgi:DNA-binding transcriptional MerR regulator